MTHFPPRAKGTAMTTVCPYTRRLRFLRSPEPSSAVGYDVHRRGRTPVHMVSDVMGYAADDRPRPPATQTLRRGRAADPQLRSLSPLADLHPPSAQCHGPLMSQHQTIPPTEKAGSLSEAAVVAPLDVAPPAVAGGQDGPGNANIRLGAVPALCRSAPHGTEGVVPPGRGPVHGSGPSFMPAKAPIQCSPVGPFYGSCAMPLRGGGGGQERSVRTVTPEQALKPSSAPFQGMSSARRRAPMALS